MTAWDTTNARAGVSARGATAWRYYAVTLALPFANGAAQSGTVFVEHALVVLVLPPLLIALAWAAHRAAQALVSAARRAA